VFETGASSPLISSVPPPKRSAFLQLIMLTAFGGSTLLRSLRGSAAAATATTTAAPIQEAATTSGRIRVTFFSSKGGAVAPKKEGEEDEDALSPVTEKRQAMTKFDRHMVWGKTGEYMPAPVLPEDPSEIAKLDPADKYHRTRMDGKERTVVIRQQKKSARQAPLNPESSWRIYFYEDGMISEKWTNSLMGWTSNADPYQSSPPLTFQNAADAVYFAKKRGWNYVVKQPVLRYMRNDDAQYQDNFLPQAVAAKIQAEGTSCDYWHRSSAGTSHYFRPLKYHGDGLVPQHGPNGDAQVLPHVDGYYKIR